jgi:membrane protease YdiL (CAAX protease family)
LARFAQGWQITIIVFLNVGLYSALKLRYRRPVLKPLGWVMPQTGYIVAALVGGPSFAAAVTLYLRLNNHRAMQLPIPELLALGVIFGSMLEEALFGGWLLPVLAQITGTVPAVIITTFLFALFHGHVNLVHWFWFTATETADGWLRVASRSTTAPALMHAAYNLSLFLLTEF